MKEIHEIIDVSSINKIKMDNVRVIGRENNRRKIKEAIQIYKR